MKNTHKLLLISSIMSLCSCASPAQNSSAQSGFKISSTQYEGESTVRIYQVTFDWDGKKPVSARLDMEFIAKNGEPIADSARYGLLMREISPVMVRKGHDSFSGLYGVCGFYYDFDCTEKIGYEDVATHDLDIYYFLE